MRRIWIDDTERHPNDGRRKTIIGKTADGKRALGKAIFLDGKWNISSDIHTVLMWSDDLASDVRAVREELASLMVDARDLQENFCLTDIRAPHSEFIYALNGMSELFDKLVKLERILYK